MIHLVTPTRDRPQNLERLVASVLATAARPEAVEIAAGIDPSDTATRVVWEAMCSDMMARRRKGEPYVRLWAEIAPKTPAEFWRDLSRHAEPDDLVMMCADDVEFVTPGWDEAVAAAFFGAPDPWLVFANDGHQGGNLATHPFLRGVTVKALGGLTTGRWSQVNDTWLWCLFHLFTPPRVTYLPDVEIPHRFQGSHPQIAESTPAGKAALLEHGGAEATRQVAALCALAGIDETSLDDGHGRDWIHISRSPDGWSAHWS